MRYIHGCLPQVVRGPTGIAGIVERFCTNEPEQNRQPVDAPLCRIFICLFPSMGCEQFCLTSQM
jgi:hypothetical protein